MKIIVLFLLASVLTQKLHATKFEYEYKIPEQRSITMCLQGPKSCACCDVFFGDCRKNTPIFVFAGNCTELNEFIYDLRYSGAVDNDPENNE